MLIDKLREYKGKELEVINEASTFASETVEPNNDHEVCIICQFYHKVNICDRKLNYFHVLPEKYEFEYVI